MTTLPVLQIILTLFVASFIAAKIEDSFYGRLTAFVTVFGASYALYLNL